MATGIAVVPAALSVNESQPAGSGLLADLRTFAALGAYPLGAVTAAVAELPSDGSGRRSQVSPVPAESVAAQVRAALQHQPRAVKLGALHAPETAEAVADLLRQARGTSANLPVTVRPALRTRAGTPRISESAQAAAAEHCYPLASVLVCSTSDAALLTGQDMQRPEHLEIAARSLAERYGVPVLVTGGRLTDAEESVDCLWDGGTLEYFASPRMLGFASVGLGDTLTAAITVYLMNGFGPADAVAQAKTYLEQALARAVPIGRDLLLNPAFAPHPLEAQ